MELSKIDNNGTLLFILITNTILKNDQNLAIKFIQTFYFTTETIFKVKNRREVLQLQIEPDLTSSDTPIKKST